MAVLSHKRAVGAFSSRKEAEDALDELRAAGFPMDSVSVVAKDADKGDRLSGADVSDEHGNKPDAGTATGAVAGTAVGMLGGLLVGLGTLIIPGVGPVIAAGTVGSTLATTLAGAGIGAATGGLVGALADLGIPEEDAKAYSNRLFHGDYLVIVDGTTEEIARAETVLSNRGIKDWAIYNRPNA
ncbi:MAG TPA: general stress protein [Candidatus Obscuribacterales bacterium]